MKRVILALLMGAMVVFGATKSFTLTTVDNKKIHITIKENGISVKEYPNKVIILDFFGKHCPPCRMEMPILGELQSKKGFLQIIGIHVQEPLNSSDLQDLKQRGINYPIVDYLTNPQNREFVAFIGQLTRWQGSIPYLLFFDKSGEFQGYHLGLASKEGLEKFIDKLAKGEKH